MTASERDPRANSMARPGTVQQARAILASDRSAWPLGGGTWVVPAQREATHGRRWVVTRSVEGLDDIGVDPDGNLLVGAAVTLRRIELDEQVREGWPMLAAAIAHVAGPAVRNAATLGGSIALGAESPDPSLALDALDARVRMSDGEQVREVDVSEVPTASSLERAVLIERARIPRRAALGWGLERLTLRGAADRPFVIVAVVIAPASVSVRAAVGRARPVALSATEAAIMAGQDHVRALGEDARRLHGGAVGDDVEYAARVLRVLAGRAADGAIRMAEGA